MMPPHWPWVASPTLFAVRFCCDVKMIGLVAVELQDTAVAAKVYELLAPTAVYYGGDGSTTFMLPDLRGRTPVGGGFASQNAGWQPPGVALGGLGGVETVQLTAATNRVDLYRALGGDATLDAGPTGP